MVGTCTFGTGREDTAPSGRQRENNRAKSPPTTLLLAKGKMNPARLVPQVPRNRKEKQNHQPIGTNINSRVRCVQSHVSAAAQSQTATPSLRNDGGHEKKSIMVHFGFYENPKRVGTPVHGTSPILSNGLLSSLRGTLAETRDGGPHGHGRGGAERRQKETTRTAGDQRGANGEGGGE